MVVNYSLGKIYKIVCNTSGLVYIGSTCEPRLCTRLARHVIEFKTKKRNPIKYIYVSSHEIIQNENYDIILIENYPCDNKDDLHRRERYFIETMDCVNMIIPKREKGERIEVHREYNNKNRDEINRKNLIHYHENKELVNKKRCRRIQCYCGIDYSKSNITAHMKSKKHIQYHQSKLIDMIHESNRINQLVKESNAKFKSAQKEYQNYFSKLK